MQPNPDGTFNVVYAPLTEVALTPEEVFAAQAAGSKGIDRPASAGVVSAGGSSGLENVAGEMVAAHTLDIISDLGKQTPSVISFAGSKSSVGPVPSASIGSVSIHETPAQGSKAYDEQHSIVSSGSKAPASSTGCEGLHHDLINDIANHVKADVSNSGYSCSGSALSSARGIFSIAEGTAVADAIDSPVTPYMQQNPDGTFKVVYAPLSEAALSPEQVFAKDAEDKEHLVMACDTVGSAFNEALLDHGAPSENDDCDMHSDVVSRAVTPRRPNSRGQYRPSSAFSVRSLPSIADEEEDDPAPEVADLLIVGAIRDLHTDIPPSVVDVDFGSCVSGIASDFVPSVPGKPEPAPTGGSAVADAVDVQDIETDDSRPNSRSKAHAVARSGRSGVGFWRQRWVIGSLPYEGCAATSRRRFQSPYFQIQGSFPVASCRVAGSRLSGADCWCR
jgi:hypothetical protein